MLLAAAAAESADPAHYRMANTEPWQPLVPIIQLVWFISSYGCIELGVFFFLQTKRTVRTLDGCISFEVLFSIIKKQIIQLKLIVFLTQSFRSYINATACWKEAVQPKMSAGQNAL